MSTPSPEVGRLLQEFDDVLPTEPAALTALLDVPFADQEQYVHDFCTLRFASNNTFLCPRLPPLLIRNTLFYPHTRYWKTLELKFSLRSLAQTAFRNFETTLLLGHGRGMLNNTTVAEARARLDELVGVTKAVEEIEVRRVHAGAGESQGGQPSNAGQDGTAASQSNLPLDVQLAKTYGLSKQDHELFQLLALQMTARSNLFGSQMLEYADHKSTTVFTDLAKM